MLKIDVVCMNINSVSNEGMDKHDMKPTYEFSMWAP